MNHRGKVVRVVMIVLMFCLAMGSVLSSQILAAKKVVTYWSWSPVKSTTDRMVAAFQAKNKNIEIKATIYNYPDYVMALKTAAASNSLPDLIGLEPGAMVQEYKNYLEPLQNTAAKIWGAQWQNKFYPIGVEQARLGNETGDANFYMLPMELQTTNLWYNIPLFKKLGLRPPKNWNELKEVAQKLQKAGIAPMLQGAGDGWQNIDVFMMIAQQTAPGVIYKAEDGKASFTDAGLVQAMSIWKQLFTEKIIQPGALGMSVYPNAVSLFNSGLGGMISLGSWHMQSAKADKPEALAKGMLGFGAFLFPDVTGSGKPSNPLGGIDFGIGLTKNGRSKPEAALVLQSFVSGSGIQAAINDFNDLPAVKGIKPKTFTTAHEKQLWALFTEQWLPKVTARQLKSPAIRQGLMDALAAVAVGQKTPESAMNDLQKVSEKSR
jgi:raffinose/stachyose/melibiose transport system substrate-binding protein